MELFDLFEREGRERKRADGATPPRRGIRGFFDRMFAGDEDEDEDEERDRRQGSRAYDRDARDRRRDNDSFDFD
ncbi:MAG: hypothetical protein C0506_02970 [Anaerolinea sp.]|nr:hypothetical protein [Anaerolinea sp.]